MNFLEKVQALKKFIDESLYEIAKDSSLSLNEVRIIIFLYKNSDLNVSKDIVNRLMLSKSHVSMTVDLLVKKGYVIKVNDALDSKKIHLILESKADDVINKFKIVSTKLKNVLFKGFTDKEMENLKSMLDRVYSNIE